MAEDIFGNEISVGAEVVFAKKLAKGHVFSVANDDGEEVVMVKHFDARGKKAKYEPVDGASMCVVDDTGDGQTMAVAD